MTMVEARCRVVSITGGRALVEADGSGGGCGRCDPASGCQAVSFARLMCSRPRHLEIDCGDWPARVGERLVIGIPEGGLARGALAGYLLPLAGLVGSAGLARALGLGDLESVAAGAAGFLAALVAARGILSSRARLINPVILRRV